MQTILRSKKVLIDKKFQAADIVIQGSVITAVQDYKSIDIAIDLGERRIVPGFVDLHSDSIEKEIEPRPGARFPLKMAIVELDKKLAMAGITTIYHAVSFNDAQLSKGRGTQDAKELIEKIHEINNEQLRVENLIHIRFEITSDGSVETIKKLIKEKKAAMFSIMDHSPGQGQFKTIEAWKKYHLNAYVMNEEEIENYLKDKTNKNKSDHSTHTENLVRLALQQNLPVLSHDDDSSEKLNALKALGIHISEFPLSIEVAKAAKQMQIATGMGAPNVVRGGSQSGNIAAKDLIANGACDYLCSDYHIPSMLLSPYRLKEDIDLDLAAGFAMISTTPAALASLKNKEQKIGEIKEGFMADIAVIDELFFPKVVLTIKNGEIVYNGIRGFTL